MFDVSFWEILVVFVLGLVVIGPERLPGTIKTCAIWFSRFKRSIRDARTEFEQQIGADEIRREIHNEQVMESMRKYEAQRLEMESKVNDFKNEVEDAISATDGGDSENTESIDHWRNPKTGNSNTSAMEQLLKDHEALAEQNTSDPGTSAPDNAEEPREPEPHNPMILDDDGTDASALPGRKPASSENDNTLEDQNGK